MDIDETKGYLLIQDNGDNTCTNTIHVPDQDVHVVVIIEMSIDDLFEAFSKMANAGANLGEMNEMVIENAIVIPDTIEEG